MSTLHWVRSILAAVIFLFLLAGLSNRAAAANPFSCGVDYTLSQQLAAAEAVVLAELISLPAEKARGDSPATFRLVEVLKGKEFAGDVKEFDAHYFGDAAIGSTFVVLVERDAELAELTWHSPMPADERVQTYFRKLLTLPADGPRRVEFFLAYLEDQDYYLAKDAAAEVDVSYRVLQKVKDKLDHDQLLRWIKDVDHVSVVHRRLYFKLLSICGDENDAPYLEGLIKSPDRKQRTALSDLLACYITLRGEDGIALVEDRYLKKFDADYAETYSGIMAVRFHAAETDVLSKKRIVQTLRHLLDRPDLADLIIPDLARLKDWQSAPRLMELYRTAVAGNNWVRVPVIQYLRTCPDQEMVKDYLKECAELDPQAMQKAIDFYGKKGVLP